MKTTGIPTWLFGTALAFSALSAPAFGQVSVGITIGTPPPPVRYEVAPPPPPDPGFVWVQGFWAPEGGRYAWRPGHWIHQPYEGAGWHPAQWEHGDHGYRYREGYWEHREVHGNGHAYGHYKHDDHDDHGHDHDHDHHD